MIEQRITLAKGGAASCPGGVVRLGYEGNQNVYRLRIEQKDEWSGLTVRACWHIRGCDPPASLVQNGVVDVPPQVTAHPGEGCITFEGTDGERTVTSADVHFRVAPNSGVEDGSAPEPGTSAWEAFIKELLEKLGGSSGSADETATSPEQFGAVGNGITDDAPALAKALESGKPVRLTQDLYLKSRLLIIDKDVVLDGCGHTLYCNGAALDFTENSDFLAIYSRTISAEGADCRIYREKTTHYDTYHRGYIEYKGRKPIPQEEVYTDYTVTGFNEHRAVIKNVRMVCTNFKGLCALTLRKMCHSVIENVQTVCEDVTGTGSVGILVDSCCSTALRGCYSSGWTDDLSCKVTNRGYGFCCNGNGIVIDGCESWNCKHDISVAGNRDYWSTDIRVQNCTFGCEFDQQKRIDGSYRYQQIMDSHAGGYGVRFDDCNIIVRNANESASPIAFYLTAPDVHVSGLEVLCDGGGCWATVGGLAEKIYLDNVRGDNLILQPGSMYERAREFHLNGCKFKRLQNSYDRPIRIFMTDCTILQLVDNVQWLKADGCYFRHDLDWGSHACITILDEGIFTGCTIVGHTEETIAPRRSIIEAPENSIHMSGCKIYIRQGKNPICNTEQADIVNCWVENVFGFYPDTENDVLDKNELF